MCRCDDTGEEGVELRLLKALLTAVTSPSLPLHGQALLLAIRACYNVFLTSRSEASQAAARATLTQMITVVFQRLESGTLAVSVAPVVVTGALGISSSDTSSASTFVQQFLNDVAVAIDPFGIVAEGVQVELDDAFALGAIDPQGPTVEDLYDSSDPLDAQHISWRERKDDDDDVPPAESNASQTVASGDRGSIEHKKQSPEEERGLDTEDTSDTSEAQTESKANATTGAMTTTVMDLRGTLEKDAFLVFRALCKLSIRTVDGSTAGEAAVMRGKALALELVKILLENSGPVFRNGDRFLNAIRQYLCLALLKNCASSSQGVQALCASIFLTLFMCFRKELKAEVGVFYPMILLRPIEIHPHGAGGNPSNASSASVSSGYSSSSAPSTVDPAQRGVVLRCLRDICEDGQALVDMFVNYDCDIDGANLFERTVSATVKIAQNGLGPSNESLWGDSTDVLTAQRREALRCLAAMMGSLLKWYLQASSKALTALDQKRDAVRVEQQEEGAKVRDSADDTADAKSHGSVHDPRVQSIASDMVSGKDLLIMDENLRLAFLDRLSSDGGRSIAELAKKSGRKEAEVVASWKSFKRVFEEGVAVFNDDKPTRGIAFLQNHHLLGESPVDVARFLASTRTLGRSQIGDYLGERDEYAIRVMHAYVDFLDLEGLEFDVAIRRFLSGFRLPGEAQKIDRLMEKFAERYVRCNQNSFKSADVAYVLAYSVIMLNTDAHNPMVKNKMSKEDFLRNNRGINDGGDLPKEWMEALYDRIVKNEIKMQGDFGEGWESIADQAAAADRSTGGSWFNTVMALVPGRQRASAAEPADAAVRRAAAFLREKAQGALFYSAQDAEAVRPMMDATWAPVLGALSVAFEYEDAIEAVLHCLTGLVHSIGITARLNMVTLRSTFVSVLASFTSLHVPARMGIKHALAFRDVLKVAESEGNVLGEDWLVVLRCVSRFELLKSLNGNGSDEATLFMETADVDPRRRPPRSSRQVDASSCIADMRLQAMTRPSPQTVMKDRDHPSSNVSMGHAVSALPSAAVLAVVDPQELNRLFVRSPGLDGDAIVEFVRTLCAVSREELRVGHGLVPRVFSLGKIVETAHFNMDRIRLVWARIWAVLSDFFAEAGCHPSLAVSMFAVDSLRQLGIKFLERDELANYTFQNDFLRPFVTLVRRSGSSEIRELVIRCVSQMVLARYANIKSGWKSVFMVYTSAAHDDNPHLVRLAFETVEKIVREHFFYITETEAATFTDCVNCLVAFTDNPHSIDVSLNAIAFLRYCALQLAEGDVSLDLGPSGLPSDAEMALDVHGRRIRPSKEENAAVQPLSFPSGRADGDGNGGTARSSNGNLLDAPSACCGRFTDRDEHMYFWFPLLVGLSELTFDPRPELRRSALGVLFDILKCHGGSFTSGFWIRVFDSVLLPMFDQVRAEILDTTTFADESRRSQVDAWLFETCTATLQHIVDVVVKYYKDVPGLLERLLTLLSGFIRRQHEELSSVGVAALSRLVLAAAPKADDTTWACLENCVVRAMEDSLPGVRELMQRRMEARASDDHDWSIGAGSGARRLAEVRCRARTQLLLAQAIGGIFESCEAHLPTSTAAAMLDCLYDAAEHALLVDGDFGLRQSLRVAYAADGVPSERALGDPPLIRLEIVAVEVCLQTLKMLISNGDERIAQAANAESRLSNLCLQVLRRYEQQSAMASASSDAHAQGVRSSSNKPPVDGYHEEVDAELAAIFAVENASLAPVVVETLESMLAINADVFRSKLAREFFPVLTGLIGTPTAPPEVQKCLADIFSRHFMPTGTS